MVGRFARSTDELIERSNRAIEAESVDVICTKGEVGLLIGVGDGDVIIWFREFLEVFAPVVAERGDAP